MISFGVYDCFYRDYVYFDSEENARKYIDKQIKEGICFESNFRLFRRQDLEI